MSKPNATMAHNEDQLEGVIAELTRLCAEQVARKEIGRVSVEILFDPGIIKRVSWGASGQREVVMRQENS